jgi:ferric-dicitrate binding protein FerR (iron transport regulator)
MDSYPTATEMIMAWWLSDHQTGRTAMRCFVATVTLIYLLMPLVAEAQGSGCVLQPAGSPARQVLHCQDGLTIEAELGADFTLVDRDRDNRPDAAMLRSRALLIETPSGSKGGRFEVLTPQAVAAVRGTQWAVDVGSGTTAVFVISGRVLVRRSNLRSGVTLAPGQGVDVDQGMGPLTVRRWPAARASALLARFGR